MNRPRRVAPEPPCPDSAAQFPGSAPGLPIWEGDAPSTCWSPPPRPLPFEAPRSNDSEVEAAFRVQTVPWPPLSWVVSPGHHPPCLSFLVCQVEGSWGTAQARGQGREGPACPRRGGQMPPASGTWGAVWAEQPSPGVSGGPALRGGPERACDHQRHRRVRLARAGASAARTPRWHRGRRGQRSVAAPLTPSPCWSDSPSPAGGEGRWCGGDEWGLWTCVG